MLLEAVIILSIIEGLTEFIPVSSTGHLILAGHLLNFKGDAEHTFDVFIQLGAILAVVFLYWDKFFCLIPFKNHNGKFQGFNGIKVLIAGCLPALFLGAIFHKTIKAYLFTPQTVAAGLILGAFLLLYVENKKRDVNIKDIEDISILHAIYIGFFQCLSLWPGMSRSASTIAGGMITGLSRSVATEFSFIVAVPIMFAAVSYDLLKSINHLDLSHVAPFSIGFIISFISALIAVRVFVRFVAHFSLTIFATYRIVLGIIVFLVF